MIESMLMEIDFARHQRWIDRAAGGPVPLLFFDSASRCVYGVERPQAVELATAFAHESARASAVQRHPLPPTEVALVRWLGSVMGEPVGWVAVLVDDDMMGASAFRLDLIAEALDDLADGIHAECNQRHEFDSMTEELAARYEELHLVYAVDEHLKSQSGRREGVFEKLLQSTAGHMNTDVVAFVQPSRKVCLHATTAMSGIHNLDLVLVEMRGDLFRYLQASGDSIALNARDDPRRDYIFTHMPYKILACPVRSGRDVEAILVLLNRDEKPDFTNSDRKLAEVLANQLSSLSNTYVLLESMAEFNRQMAETLIEAVEAKDPYTRGHSERVNFLSMEIGRAMGLVADQLENLYWGSLLHDVGKIGIPESILCKPGPLTKDEYTFIKVHPERSYEILRHIKLLESALPGVRHHQERFDGKGYPRGLQGERIPLEARIMAVADTYDSITSSRAYRPGRTHEVAMREIESVSGTQLDPRIVAVFRELVTAEPEWLRRFHIRREKI